MKKCFRNIRKFNRAQMIRNASTSSLVMGEKKRGNSEKFTTNHSSVLTALISVDSCTRRYYPVRIIIVI